jgi:hypothetical protein
MGRKNTNNQSFYHFKATYFSDEGDITGSEYFLTAFDLCDKYKCCRKTIYDKVRDPLRLGRYGQFSNVIIQKVKEPVFVRVANPRLYIQDPLTG